MKLTAKNITDYANKEMDRTDSDNIAISLPKLNKNTFKALQDRFKSVKQGPFGYIRFER